MNHGIPAPLSLAQLPTPIHFLEAPSRRLNRRIWVKRDDLTGSLTSGNKIRKLEFSLAAARRTEADVILSTGATQTNHGRATAAACAALGLDCHLLLLGDASDNDRGNHFLMRLLGARIDYVDPAGYHKREELLQEMAARYRSAGRKPFVIPTGASDGLGSLGYVAAAEEIGKQTQDMKQDFDHVVVAVGSGGTATGLFAGRQYHALNWRLHGVTVCDDADYFRAEASRILCELKRDYLPNLEANAEEIEFLDGFKEAGYGRSSPELRRRLVLLARESGLVLDPVYTMKAWTGLESLIERGEIEPDANVLFIHTGGTSGLLGKGPQFTADDLEL